MAGNGGMELVDRLWRQRTLPEADLLALVGDEWPETRRHAAMRARGETEAVYGRRVFVRGLIEISNYCSQDCLYCGIRRGNAGVERYRLRPEEILECCRRGAELGFKTFVLQGGEDAWFTDDRLVELVAAIRWTHPEAAITLSLGERSRESYLRLFKAGANRYLLRHETADAGHYASLHPAERLLGSRVRCLEELKAIGYQTGSGFMVGSPGQTHEHLVKDLLFLRRLEPQMIGIGPFIPHSDTEFADQPAGDPDFTVYLLSLARLLLPHALLPATTALATLDPRGREKAVLAGANVVMPNLSPSDAREHYVLYDNKAHSGLEAAEHVAELRERFAGIGYELSMDRGDFRG